MIKHVSKFALAATALAALPGVAQAGTSTDTGSASMTVINQCSITGGNVNLGTYTTNQTWQDVGNVLGFTRGGYSPGTLGQEYINFGSVTCDSGTPYTLRILSSGGGGQIKLNVGGIWPALLEPMIKKIGSDTVPDVTYTSRPGAGGYAPWGVAGTGTGSPQPLLGSVVILFGEPAALDSWQSVDTVGTFSDTLNYTLNF